MFLQKCKVAFITKWPNFLNVNDFTLELCWNSSCWLIFLILWKFIPWQFFRANWHYNLLLDLKGYKVTVRKKNWIYSAKNITTFIQRLEVVHLWTKNPRDWVTAWEPGHHLMEVNVGQYIPVWQIIWNWQIFQSQKIAGSFWRYPIWPRMMLKTS